MTGSFSQQKRDSMRCSGQERARLFGVFSWGGLLDYHFSIVIVGAQPQKVSEEQENNRAEKLHNFHKSCNLCKEPEEEKAQEEE